MKNGCPFSHLHCDGARPRCNIAQAAFDDISRWEIDPAHRNRLCANDSGGRGNQVPPLGRHRKPMHAFTHKAAAALAELRAEKRTA